MTALTIETARLRLVPWAPEHHELLAAWSASPLVTRFVGDGATWSPERAADRHARALGHWERHGFGWRIAELRDGGAPVGLMALNVAPDDTPGLSPSDHEIGWWLAPDAWGRGYAREGAAAVRDEAFGRLGAPSVVARIAPANAGSVAVAEATGLRWERTTATTAGIAVALYRATARPSAP